MISKSYDIIIWYDIRKFGENRQRTENREQTDRQTENSKPEATLIPVDSRGERANISPDIVQIKSRVMSNNIFMTGNEFF